MRLLMNQLRAVGVASSIGLAVLAVPLMASSQCIEVTPESWDYGNVEVGTSTSQIFSVYSCQSTDLTIYYIGVVFGDTAAFSLTSAPDVPFAIPGGETEEFEVVFAPPDLGPYESSLYIVHDAAGSETFVNLYGVGVQQAPAEGKSWALIKALYR